MAKVKLVSVPVAEHEAKVLHELASVLKDQMSLDGDAEDIVMQVAKELDIERASRPLREVAGECIDMLGVDGGVYEVMRKAEETVIKAEERAAAKAKQDADANWEVVHMEAVHMLGSLSPRDLATHAGALIARLADAGARVCKEAAKIVGTLSPEVIAMHVTCLVDTIDHKDPRMRNAAAEALGKLSPELLETNAALVAKLENADADVAQIFGKLALKIRAAALVAELPSTLAPEVRAEAEADANRALEAARQARRDYEAKARYEAEAAKEARRLAKAKEQRVKSKTDQSKRAAAAAAAIGIASAGARAKKPATKPKKKPTPKAKLEATQPSRTFTNWDHIRHCEEVRHALAQMRWSDVRRMVVANAERMRQEEAALEAAKQELAAIDARLIIVRQYSL